MTAPADTLWLAHVGTCRRCADGDLCADGVELYGPVRDARASATAPADTLDIDALEAAVAAMTPGPYRWGDGSDGRVLCLYGSSHRVAVLQLDAGSAWVTSGADTDGLARVATAAPALIAKARRLAELEPLLKEWREAVGGFVDTGGGSVRADKAELALLAYLRGEVRR